MSPTLRLIAKRFAAESGFLRRISPNCCRREFSTVSADRQLLPPPSTAAPWLGQPPAFSGGDTLYNFYSPSKEKSMSFDIMGGDEETELARFNKGSLFHLESDLLADRRSVDLPVFPGCIWAPSKVCSLYDEWTTPIIEETQENFFCISDHLERWDLASKAFPKQFKGRMGGISHRGNHICFGKYALKALEPGWITARQIEAGRRAMVRNARGAKIWVRVIADKPVTLKPAEVRMGRGKGSPAFRVGVVQPGRILYELEGVAENVAKKAVIIAASKLPMQTQFICSGYAM